MRRGNGPGRVDLLKPRQEAAAVGVWFGRGSAHEPPEIAGITHLLEHLLLRQTRRRKRLNLARAMDRLGGEVDAWTSQDALSVTIVTTSDAIGEAFRLLEEVVLAPDFSNDGVALEKLVCKAEIASAADDPIDRVSELLLRAAWGDHPLARPVLGWEETIDSIDIEHLRTCWERLIEEGGLVLCSVSPGASKETRTVTTSIPRSHGPAPLGPAPEWLAGFQAEEKEGIDQAYIRVAFPLEPEDHAKAMLANQLLGAGHSSRVFQALREEAGVAYDVFSDVFWVRTHGLMEIGWSVGYGEVERSLEMLHAALKHLAEDGFSSEEVASAKAGILRRLRVAASSASGRIELEADAWLRKGSLGWGDKVLAEVEGIGICELNSFVKRILGNLKPAWAVVGPPGSARKLERWRW